MSRGLALLAFGCALVSCGKTRVHPSWRDVLPGRLDVESAREEARRTGKPAILFFHADWCEMHNDVAVERFADPRVNADLVRHFIPVAIDATNDDDPVTLRLTREFRPLGAPDIVIVDARFERVGGAQWSSGSTSIVTSLVTSNAP